MKIEVKQEHIDLGQKCTLNKCPIALAIREATGYYTAITPDKIYFPRLTYPEKVNTPAEVRSKITSYDLGNGMTPFSFELDIT